MASAITIATGTGDSQVVTSSPSRLMGWSIAETAGTPAAGTVVLRDGTSTAGQPVAFIELASNGSNSQWLGPQGVVCPNGIFLDRTASESTVIVYVE